VREKFLGGVKEFYSRSEGDALMPAGVVFISSRTGEGMDDLVKELSEAFRSLDF